MIPDDMSATSYIWHNAIRHLLLNTWVTLLHMYQSDTTLYKKSIQSNFEFGSSGMRQIQYAGISSTDFTFEHVRLRLMVGNIDIRITTFHAQSEQLANFADTLLVLTAE